MTILPPNILKCMPQADRKALGKAGLLPDEAENKRLDRLEKELQREVAKYLRLHGITFFRQSMRKRTTGTVGWPDFTFAIKGQACAIECKIPPRTLSASQEIIKGMMIFNGWQYCVAHTLNDVVYFIRGMEGVKR